MYQLCPAGIRVKCMNDLLVNGDALNNALSLFKYILMLASIPLIVIGVARENVVHIVVGISFSVGSFYGINIIKQLTFLNNESYVFKSEQKETIKTKQASVSILPNNNTVSSLSGSEISISTGNKGSLESAVQNDLEPTAEVDENGYIVGWGESVSVNKKR